MNEERLKMQNYSEPTHNYMHATPCVYIMEDMRLRLAEASIVKHVHEWI
jgi:hypothetical protein